jgi:predicted HicB family RNase H-like nuclease
METVGETLLPDFVVQLPYICSRIRRKDNPMPTVWSNVTSVNLRLENALHQQLIAEAKRSERSLPREIVYRLRRSIETQNKD